MEIVSVTAAVGGVGEVLNASQSASTPTPFQTKHHSLRACLQHQAHERPDEEEEEDDEDPAMETDQGSSLESHTAAATSPPFIHPQVILEDDSNCGSPARYNDEGVNDQMDYEESRSTETFLEDEDSSCRTFPEGTGDTHQGGSSSPIPTPLPESGRRNKRKNFKPRNIVYFADSDENEASHSDPIPMTGDSPLDLSEVKLRRSLLPKRLDGATDMAVEDPVINPRLNCLLSGGSPPLWNAEPPSAEAPDLKEYVELRRRLLGLYGFQDLQENLAASFGGAPFLSGKILESLKSNGNGSSPLGESRASSASGNGSAEPPTPPHTPQRDITIGSSSSQEGNSRNSQGFESGQQQQVIQARLFGDRNFSTLLHLAALQEGKSGGVSSCGGVPLPPTLDPNKSIPTTPTTPTSTAVTPGLANLSLGNGNSTPPTMVPTGGIGVREHLAKQPIDYTRYVKRYSSSMECGSPTCRELNHREHFHCIDCTSKVFSKKEEMIRHFKWHKKRDESLQHGFMRYSPTDDCSDKFANCSHNRKQTHYHCLKDSCDKVYISTSDVQMHANYHRKDSAIMQEGFQRFRASEDCNQASCPFSGQRTTHFHCMRFSCNFTFKNKADMEKHKTYHIKDEQLTKDGFKKFMKQEDCGYDGCKLSKVSNHIHCIRSECNYVLHSSGQIFAHKRKHERQDHEKAYRQYKLAHTVLNVPESHSAFSPLLHDSLRPLGGLGGPIMSSFGGELNSDRPPSPMGHTGQNSPNIPPAPSAPGIGKSGHSPFLMGAFPPGIVEGQHPLVRLLGVPPTAHNIFPCAPNTSTASTPTSSSSGPASPVDLSVSVENNDDGYWDRNIRFYGRDDTCRADCELSNLEHWHCEECEALFHTKETAKDHGRVHEQQSAITEENYTRVLPGENSRNCPPECQVQDQAEHFHCNWEGCSESILAAGDKPFRRLEHFRIHDFARRYPVGPVAGGPGAIPGVGVASVTSIDAMFKRKRGRPPKNRIIELPVSSSHDSPQAIFTSFKLPKSSPPPSQPAHQPVGLPSNPLLGLPPPSLGPLSQLVHMGRELPGGIVGGNVVPSGILGQGTIPAPPPCRMPVMLPTNEQLVTNPRQPHAEVVDGFYMWEEGFMCCDQLCPHLGRRHFHCSHPRCIYVTASSDALSGHSQDFHENTTILEGFIAFDKNVNCRLASCQSNKVTRHYHCTKCSYSFIRHQGMAAHAEKHQQEREPLDHSLGPVSPIYLQKRPESPLDSNRNDNSPTTNGDTPTKSQSLIPVVKSSGIFYPLSPFPNSSQGLPKTVVSSANNEPGALITPIAPSSKSTTAPTYTLPVTGSLTITATLRSPNHPQQFSPVSSQERMDQEDSEDIPENKPLSDDMNDSELSSADDRSISMTPVNERSCSTTMEQEWSAVDHNNMMYSLETSCGRPFCKLKKKEHYHCQVCNQAFSEQEKLRPHLLRHMSGFGSPLGGSDHGIEDKEDNPRSESPQDNGEDIKPRTSPEAHEQLLFNNNSINPSPGQLPVIPSTSSPIISLSNLAGQQPHPQFPSPLIYSQPGFHGLPSPFGPHFGITGMFPGALPRLLPPGAWPHPALAAMTHPHLMLPQVRSNGEIPPGSPSAVSSLNPIVGTSGITSPTEPSPILPSSLNTSPHLAMLRKRLPDDMAMQETKKIRSCHSVRILKDEPVPEGYIRFRFNEDCQYPHCGYREHQTHFHCMRHDCGYSFCDKTRFVQHTARHERLDTLMGGDFQQFRSNVPCGRSECVYATMIGQQQNKASHFHCLKCEFVCTDTNKVVAHRRQHQKRDSINAAGFEKFTPSQPCGVQSCTHNQKQTHYHCLKCHYSVLGLCQMSAHKLRHLD